MSTWTCVTEREGKEKKTSTPEKYRKRQHKGGERKKERGHLIIFEEKPWASFSPSNT
jgi:hypothetical protein